MMKYEVVPDSERRLSSTGRSSPEWDAVAVAVGSGATVRIEVSSRQVIDNALRIRRGIGHLVISKRGTDGYVVWQELPNV